MKKQIIYILALILMVSVFSGCGSKTADNLEEASHEHKEGEEGHGEEGMAEVHLSDMKFQSLDIKVDSLPTRAISGVVEANGQLEVPPQHEATVTAILGANVTSIKVIEGDHVNKGQVLGYLAHPNLSSIQSNYVRAYSQLQYLEKEHERQKKLYEENVGSGKTYQQTLADYQTMKGEAKGYEAQLKQLNLDVEKIRSGDIYEYVPVVSPIKGYIEKVEVQLGQYVDPQTVMFRIVNTDHLHADLIDRKSTR
ncbi:MAG TPA: efflux transporter periplasmic adaptor subunit, partial [Cytophagales bacterium]|nr:efflux transporter periplasmic adaptor subunit [Cytophagales bacterium]